MGAKDFSETLSEIYNESTEWAKETGKDISEIFSSIPEATKSSLETIKELTTLQNENRWRKESEPEFGELINPEIEGQPIHQVKFFKQDHSLNNIKTGNEILTGNYEKNSIRSQKEIEQGLGLYKPDFIVIEGTTKNTDLSIYNELIKKAFSKDSYGTFKRDNNGYLIIPWDYDNIFSGLKDEFELQDRLYLELGGAWIYGVLNNVKMIEGEPEGNKDTPDPFSKKGWNKILKGMDKREQHVANTIEEKILENDNLYNRGIKFAISYGESHETFKDNFERSNNNLNIKYNNVHTGHAYDWNTIFEDFDPENPGESTFKEELNPINREKTEKTISNNITKLKNIFSKIGYEFESQSGKSNDEPSKLILENAKENKESITSFKFNEINGNDEFTLNYFNISLLKASETSELIKTILIFKDNVSNSEEYNNFIYKINSNLKIEIPYKFDIDNITELNDFSKYFKYLNYLPDTEILNARTYLVHYINKNFNIKLKNIPLNIGEYGNSNIIKIENKYIDTDKFTQKNENLELFLDLSSNELIYKNLDGKIIKTEYAYNNFDDLKNYQTIEKDKNATIFNNISRVKTILEQLGYDINLETNIEEISVEIGTEIMNDKENKIEKTKSLPLKFNDIYNNNNIILNISYELLNSYVSTENIIYAIFNDNNKLRENIDFINKINYEFDLKIPEYFNYKTHLNPISKLIPFLQNINYLGEYEQNDIGYFLHKYIIKKYGIDLLKIKLNIGQSNNPNILKLGNNFIDKRNEDNSYNGDRDLYFDLENDIMFWQNNKTGERGRIPERY